MSDVIAGSLVWLQRHPIANDGTGVDFEFTFFSEFGEEADEVDEFIFAQAGREAGRHHGDGADDF